MSQPFQVPSKALSQDVSGAQANTDYAATVRAGLWLLIVGFCGFLAWATLAPLDEGIPAPGRVSVESMKKRIDHNGGGIIEKILVHEGQIVKRGQDLIAFNETQAKAALNATLSQWYSGLAMEARLNAERTGAKTVTFPPELSKAAAGDSEVAAMTKA
jgi:protease secretion system membrane fusion protein